MPTFKVTIPVTGEFTATVVADDEKAAKQAAVDLSGGLCIQCSGYTTAGYDPADGDGPWDLSLDDVTPEGASEVEEVTT